MNVSVWNMHLNYVAYGPYAACSQLVDQKSQIYAGELALGQNGQGRVQNVQEMQSHPAFKTALMNTDAEPMIVTGDMNCPSHLDWTERAKCVRFANCATVFRRSHCDWAYDWPATKLLVERSKLIDSYRHLHPDEVAEPGITWSTVVKYSDNAVALEDGVSECFLLFVSDNAGDLGRTVLEPQDRVDYVYYRGRSLTPVASQTWTGDLSRIIELKPFAIKNDWPTDHKAVITDFTLNLST